MKKVNLLKKVLLTLVAVFSDGLQVEQAAEQAEIGEFSTGYDPAPALLGSSEAQDILVNTITSLKMVFTLARQLIPRAESRTLQWYLPRAVGRKVCVLTIELGLQYWRHKQRQFEPL
ncbi:MAG: hypothetical protein R2825_30975 [Saprospiraceae bacterium]